MRGSKLSTKLRYVSSIGSRSLRVARLCALKRKVVLAASVMALVLLVACGAAWAKTTPKQGSISVSGKLSCPVVTVSGKVTRSSQVVYTHIIATGVTCNYIRDAFLPDISRPPFHKPNGWSYTLRSLGGGMGSYTWRYGKLYVITYTSPKVKGS